MSKLLAILSPAKTLDMEAELPKGAPAVTRPRMASRSKELVGVLQEYSTGQLESLMSISPKLAEVNRDRWSSFGSRSNPKGPAAICFRGDVFQGFEAWTMKGKSLSWAQDHVRILSGLYGMLRPLDVIQPYRLEMGTALKTDSGKNLYEFWGDQVHKLLKKDMKEAGAEILVNLASVEYSKVARVAELGFPVVDVKFLQVDKGKAKFITLFGKQARGLLARWMADHRPKNLKDLQGFDSQGYRFHAEDSTDGVMVFTRPKPPPVRR
ncbi:hypothetical protein CBD41_10020 [bacterium TMED181]|nr:hypothetical protein [Planctomycetota bacterium]OUW41838.1 MAG: hypothetical protein CBD41_10020 [bacterium TMED181]